MSLNGDLVIHLLLNLSLQYSKETDTLVCCKVEQWEIGKTKQVTLPRIEACGRFPSEPPYNLLCPHFNLPPGGWGNGVLNKSLNLRSHFSVHGVSLKLNYRLGF